MKQYKVEIKSPTGTLIDSTIVDGALEAAGMDGVQTGRPAGWVLGTYTGDWR